MIKLYEFPLSGNSHKIRLMLSLLGLPYESIVVSGASREHKSRDFLSMNPFGQVPVLQEDDALVRDSQAILVYLASRHGGAQWWPQEPAALAAITAWLSTAANEVSRGPNALRLHHKFGRPGIALGEAAQITETLLGILEARLVTHDWLALDIPSIADVALYPYLALSPEGGVDLAAWPAVGRWLARVRALPGYVGMPGMD